MGVIVVDYLQLIENRGVRSNDRGRQQEVAEISRGLRRLAKDLNLDVAVNLKDLVTKDDLATTKRDLEQSIELLRADMNGQFKLLHWMGGVLMAGCVAVLVRLLFFPIR